MKRTTVSCYYLAGDEAQAGPFRHEVGPSEG